MKIAMMICHDTSEVLWIAFLLDGCQRFSELLWRTAHHEANALIRLELNLG